MRVDNTVSDLMSILQKKIEHDNDESKGPGGFASMMKQALNAGGAIDIGPTSVGAVDNGAKAPGSPSVTNKITPFNTRSDADYRKFYDTVADMGIIKIPDECYEIDDNGNRRLTNEGKKYIAKTRMENASTLAPASIDEAKKLYEASSAHFGEQLNQFLTNSGYAIGMTYGVGSVANYQNIGLWEEGKNSQSEPFVTYFHESGGYEKFNVMAEETSFYGAIANFGEKNKEFKKSYNTDQQKAIIDYAQELGNEMERIRLPEGRSAFMPPDTRPRYRKWHYPGNPFEDFAPGLTFHPQDSKYEPIWDATGAWRKWNK